MNYVYESLKKKLEGYVKEINFEFIAKENSIPKINAKKHANKTELQPYLHESVKESLDNWIQPIFHGFCQNGDSIFHRAVFDQVGQLLPEDSETVLRLHIPRNHASNWGHYLFVKRPDLANLHFKIKKIHIRILNYRVNQIFVHIDNSMDPSSDNNMNSQPFLSILGNLYKHSLNIFKNNPHLHSYEFVAEYDDDTADFGVVQEIDYKIKLS